MKRFVIRRQLFLILVLIESFITLTHNAPVTLFHISFVLALRFPQAIVFFMPLGKLLSSYLLLLYHCFLFIFWFLLFVSFMPLLWRSPFLLFHWLQCCSLNFRCAPICSVAAVVVVIPLHHHRCLHAQGWWCFKFLWFRI